VKRRTQRIVQWQNVYRQFTEPLDNFQGGQVILDLLHFFEKSFTLYQQFYCFQGDQLIFVFMIAGLLLQDIFEDGA
jgi:hypothetical protein